MRPALRKPLLTFHLWTGLTIGLILLVVAVTGFLLAFRTSLERKLDPHRFIVPAAAGRLNLDDLVARAKASHPQATFLSVRYFSDPTMPFMALFSDATYVHVNPHTGEVLGARKRYGEGFGFIEGIHKYLIFNPTLGENINGSLAYVYIALILAGIALWWPATRKAMKAGLTLNWKLKGRPWSLNLHKAVGIYAAGILLVSSLTGLPIAFESTRNILDFVTGSQHEEPVKVGTATDRSAPFIGFEAAARILEAKVPGAAEVYIPLPKGGVVPAYGIAANASHPNARSYVYLEPGTGSILRFTPYAEASAGYRLYYWLLSLHTVVAGGPLAWVLLVCGTLCVPILTWTGYAAYLRRKSKARSTKTLVKVASTSTPA